jgi:ligand-binding sensor domain-containing protein/signal transduction histidine kinase
MITIRQHTAGSFRASGMLVLGIIIHASYAITSEAHSAKIAIAESGTTRFVQFTNSDSRGSDRGRADSIRHDLRNIQAQADHAEMREVRFAHLTTNDGLSQGYVTAILQDRKGFMWFATRDGLNRYDGGAFVVYKNNPSDPNSLSSNFIQDLLQDDHGYLWIATNTGVNKFDPATGRCTRYLHNSKDPNSISSSYVTSIARDDQDNFWFATEASGLEKMDSSTGTFTHYRNDSDGQFVGRIAKVIAGRQGEIWFVCERGLFHLNQQSGQITRPAATRNGLSAESVYQDEVGSLWMLADSPIVGLVKYDPRTDRVTKYPLYPRAVGVPASTMKGGSVNANLLADGQDGFWVPSALGLSYFDRRTQRFTYRFQHDDTNPDSLDSNAILSIYQDRGGVLWVGTENAGLNFLSFRQDQFVRYRHRNGDPSSISPGRVKAIYQEPNGVLWLGFFPRALDRLDRKTGQVTHYIPNPDRENTLSQGTNVDTICKDAEGYLWIGGGDGGLDRFDERTGRFKHYRHSPADPNSLISDNVFTIYIDRSGHMWVGQQDGLSRFDPMTDGFTNYRPVPDSPASLANWIWNIYHDHSGMLWLGTFGGALMRFDEKSERFVTYSPDSHDPHKLNGGGITTIHEDRTGTLWVGGFDGLYRYNRQNEAFTRYTESQGLPSSTIRCILEDGVGRLWLSTQRGISRFDPTTEMFRNYDVSDGLQTNEFSDGCYESPNGEMFFGGSNGFNAFVPETVRDNPYVPPVVITNFRVFNKSVPIGAKSVLTKAIPYLDSLTLSYRDSVFSFEFAALSYANAQKNRYRYKLENLEPGWNEVGSKQRLATYTNLDPGRYIFRVQGSNSDGIWNEEGVSLAIVITPPWWKTNWFRALFAATFLALLWTAYQLRVRQLAHQFNIRLEERVSERTRIARELHDTLLQSFQGLLLRFQAGINMLRDRPADARSVLEDAVEHASQAIAEGRDAIGALRMSTVEKNDLAVAIRTIAEELARAQDNLTWTPFEVLVEGTPRDLHPILRDEVYRLATEALRNAFRHATAKKVEVEIRYDEKYFRVRVRDDGKGIPSDVLRGDGRERHYGLHGMRERAKLVGGKLTIWTEVDSGTEIELVIPGARAYVKPARPFWYFGNRSTTETHEENDRRG